MDALTYECGNTKHYPLVMFINGVLKKTRSSYIGTMEDEINLSSSNYTMPSKEKKIAVPCLKYERKYIVYLLKQRMMHCLRIGKKTCLCTKAITCLDQKCSGHMISPST